MPAAAPRPSARRDERAPERTGKPRRRGIGAAIISGLLGFVLGAVFWHFVGFWSFVSHIVLKGPPPDSERTSEHAGERAAGIETGSLPPPVTRRQMRPGRSSQPQAAPTAGATAASQVQAQTPPPQTPPPQAQAQPQAQALAQPPAVPAVAVTASGEATTSGVAAGLSQRAAQLPPAGIRPPRQGWTVEVDASAAEDSPR